MPPGLGFVLFILPVLIGIAVSAPLLFVPRLRFIAAYALFIPLFGVLGLLGGFVGSVFLARPYFHRWAYGLSGTVWPAWAITIVGIVVGVAFGTVAGVLAGRTANRLARRLFAR
jgi:ABC-type dipeptide/oligopeptide/nickel transport system permease subunit